MDDAEQPADLGAFARSFAQLAAEAHKLIPRSSAITDRVAEHLGVDPAEIPAVGQVLPVVERPNLQLALDSIASSQPDSSLIGLSAELAHYGGFSLSALLAGRFMGPGEPVPPVYDELPIDVGRTLRCVVAGLWLVRHEGAPVVIGLAPGERHGPPTERQPRLEVFAAGADVAEGVLAHLDELRQEHNVYRGKALAFAHGAYGDFGITFMPRPTTTEADVILPAADLASIERHAIGIGRRADELDAMGIHLKRGLLLYGPPGAGKTHTVGYLMATMPERTTVVLQGPSVAALGQGAAIVRALTPSMLVIEDVDLIASERGMHGMEATNPLMFQLLNEMDGLSPTDDVLFVLTTNRAEILEPALAARPGRIDHAVEIGLPGAEGRERLLDLYLQPTRNEVSDLAAIVDRTEGVTASFIRELVRRAAYDSLDDADPGLVTDRHLARALDELRRRSAPVFRPLGDEPDQ